MKPEKHILQNAISTTPFYSITPFLLNDYVRGNFHALPKNLSHVRLDFLRTDALFRVFDHFHQLSRRNCTPGIASVFAELEATGG